MNRQQKSQSVRTGKGDHDGTMHCIRGLALTSGHHALPILARAVKASATLASLLIPKVHRVIQDLENDSGMLVPKGMA